MSEEEPKRGAKPSASEGDRAGWDDESIPARDEPPKEAQETQPTPPDERPAPPRAANAPTKRAWAPWKKRLALAAAIYAVCTVVFLIVAGDRTERHTMNDHYAVQAEVWRQGHWYVTEQDMIGRARRGELDMGNDWAIVEKKDAAGRLVERRYYNSFPVFPAVLMYPFVALSGSALLFKDALFVVLFAGLAPALLFLALERLRDKGWTTRTPAVNAFLALLYAFGSVYFFTAVQGTVWFAAHVVAAALTGGYVLASLDCRRYALCFLAGLFLGCGFHTRPPMLLGVAFFAFFALLASMRAPIRPDGSLALRAGDAWKKLDKRALFFRYALFAIPIVVALGVSLYINKVRFGDPYETGHTLLNVGWMDRVKRYGLFSYHYLSRNMTCAFTLLPIVNPANAPPNVARMQISGNGLALWFTTPLFLWLLWPKKKNAVHWVLWATLLPTAFQLLLYQNSGWVQFGYRFSNDYAPYLFLLLAVGARPIGGLFRVAAAWSVAVNLFGAISFEKQGYEKYYFRQTYSVPIYNGQMGLQSTTYPPD